MHAPRIHLYNKLSVEAFFAEVKHFELALKVVEKKVDEFCLHLWRQLREEVELLHYHVVIVAE